jgi:outer membrane protein W
LFTVACLTGALSLVTPGVGAAQSTLEQFSYDSLGFRGISGEVGAMWSNKVDMTAQVGVRINLGEIAPKLRLLVGGSYFKSDLTSEEIQRLEAGIIQVVDDPSGTATVSLGTVSWSDLALAGDLQYLIVKGRAWQPYIGAGFSFHFRNGSGSRIDGTVIEDNLDQTQVGLDLTVGTDIRIARALIANVGLRGVLTGGLNTLTLGVGLGYRVP